MARENPASSLLTPDNSDEYKFSNALSQPKSNSSSNNSPAAAMCTIEEFLALKDKFCVAPQGSIPLPRGVRYGRCSESTISTVHRIRPEIEEVLRILQINGEPELRAITSANYTDTELLFIETRDDDPSNWKAAANSIQQLLARNQLPSTKIHVEIRNSARMWADRSFVINSVDDREALACIFEVEDQVAATAERALAGIITSIRWHMRGVQGGHMKPTAIVTVDPSSHAVFQEAEEKISEQLHSPRYPHVNLYLEILPGSVELAPDAMPRVLMELPRHPTNGSSIGVDGNKQLVGTLGGFVILSMPDGTRKNCIMTCFHCIGPGDPVNETEHNKNGIGLYGTLPQSPIQVTYPAELDSRGTMKQMKTYLQDQNLDPNFTDTVQSTVDTLKFLGPAGQIIGQAILGSGHELRTAENSRLDWALLECNDEYFAKNKPPTITDPKDLKNFSVPYKVYPRDTIESFGVHSNSYPVPMNEWVAMSGSRTTGVGEIAPVRAKVFWSDQSMSREVEIQANPGRDDFCEPGDSGAWIVNKKKELCGMLIGRDQNSRSFASGFMTPIALIQDDIRNRAGGAEISLP